MGPDPGQWYLNIDPYVVLHGILYCAFVDIGLSGFTLLVGVIRRRMFGGPDGRE